MSRFLKTPDDVLALDVLAKSFQSYILEHLPKHINYSKLPQKQCYLGDNGENLIQMILDNSDHQLRMYGSAKELADNVKIFREFLGTDRMFEAIHVPYFRSVVLYENLKGEKFISRSDLFVILQNMALEYFPGSNSINMRINILTPCKGRSLEMTTSGYLKFDELFFNEMEKKIQEAANCWITENIELSPWKEKLDSGDIKDFAAKFPRLDGKLNTKEDNEKVERSMMELYDTFKSEDRVAEMVPYLNESIVWTAIDLVIQKRPEMSPEYEGCPVTVRLFEDRDEKFVMEEELFHALNPKSKFKEEENVFSTISMDDVMKIYGSRIGHIEFIRTPIIRSKHRAVPVQNIHSKEFGQLAIDRFLDYMRSIIFSHKFFQKAEGMIGNMNLFWMEQSKLFKGIEHIFKPDLKTPYFLKDDIPVIAFSARELEWTEIVPTKEVRNAKVTGFTLQNLKNELVHLRLNTPFPNISDYAEPVYEAIDKEKKGEVLRTCDLFDAVFSCQLIGVLKKLPNVRSFVHNQRGCHRILGYTCEMCVKEGEHVKPTPKGTDLNSSAPPKEEKIPNTSNEVNELKKMILELKKINIKQSDRITNLEKQLATEKEKIQNVYKALENEE